MELSESELQVITVRVPRSLHAAVKSAVGMGEEIGAWRELINNRNKTA
jgi:hypothetical protein